MNEYIENRAKEFEASGNVYIHIEKMPGNPMKMVTTGDPKMMVAAAASIVVAVHQMTKEKVWKIMLDVNKFAKNIIKMDLSVTEEE